MKYVGANKVLLADTLSRLVKPGQDETIPNLDVAIAQIMKIRPTKLQSLQEESKADSSMIELVNYIHGGWPAHMRDLPIDLQP